MAETEDNTVAGPIARPANLVVLQPQRALATGDPAGPGQRSVRDYVAFDRRELGELLKVYGRMVAVGEWRDYAIDMLADRAVFSIFRRASEVPLYRVEKHPKLARKQGAYSVVSQTGVILKRGGDLGSVLKAIDKSLKLVDA